MNEKNFQSICPISSCTNVIGGKWKPILILLISNGINRFGMLQSKLPTISKQMLTKQLRELESDDIVHRKVFAEVPPRVEYSITSKGESLYPVINEMKQWGKKHHKLSQQ